MSVALKMLRKVTDLMEARNIWYCLDAGTLLGIMRESQLLPWDYDMDLFVTDEECRKVIALRWLLRLRGYRVKISRLRQDLPPMKRVDVRAVKIWNRRYGVFPGSVRLDIFIKYRQDDLLCWAEAPKYKLTKKCVPAKFFKRIIMQQFEEKGYWIPEAYEDYLTYRYQDWRTPVKEWNHVQDDHAIVKE